jgi:lipid-A-disaccharide synthase
MPGNKINDGCAAAIDARDRAVVRIGIVAGEASGDQLGADLIRALHKINPNIVIEGIAGPQMLAAGCKALFPMDQIAVMGIMEVLKHIPEILTIRSKLRRYFLANPPDVFIGIDAPDFNLTLEEKLKAARIPTVHYVSPTVWAWRRGRIKKIARAVDLLLSILPFEEEFYQRHSNIPVKFVGHPLADQIPLQKVPSLEGTSRVVAILPGSRANEIKYLGELFLRTAQWCAEHYPNLTFVAPMVNAARRAQFMEIKNKIAPQLNIQIVDGQAQQVMAAADVVLLASGTATLEAMLLKKPMVVAYRMSRVNHFIAQCLIATPFIALPNLLANKMLVPEFIQEKATPENLGAALLNYLQDAEQVKKVTDEFNALHLLMRRDASAQAAQAIMELTCK